MFNNWYIDDRYRVLSAQMQPLVAYCASKHKGGECYFNELDAMIKCNYELLENFIKWATEHSGCNCIVMSGKIGEIVKKYIAYKLPDIRFVVMSGGLRHDEFYKKQYNRLNFLLQDRNLLPLHDAIFIDDSLYSGKTYDRVQSLAEFYRTRIKGAYVFYDGSKEKRNDVISLYRYLLEV